ncbi:hypothetical protein D3C87_2014530 [compost metagenome]
MAETAMLVRLSSSLSLASSRLRSKVAMLARASWVDCEVTSAVMARMASTSGSTDKARIFCLRFMVAVRLLLPSTLS